MPNYGEYTYTEIAKELGVSRERVRQIERRALQKLEKRFRQLGYDETFVSDIKTSEIYIGSKIKTINDPVELSNVD